jgi:hypothetical protein
MPRSVVRTLTAVSLSFSLLPTAGFASPACDSIETRKAVLDHISSDGSNRLADFAARNASSPPRGTKAAKAKKVQDDKPFYELGQRFVTTSKTKDKLTVKCSGALSASVGDAKATKEVEFTVQQSKDGKLSVSVEPFQF